MLPVKPFSGELPCSVHHDQPSMDDSLIYVDDRHLHFSDNNYCIHQNLGRLHNANPDQFQCHDGTRCMLSQMQVLLDYGGDTGPSLKNALLDAGCHTDNGFLGKD